MNCNEIQFDLPLYSDNVLSAEVGQAIEQHLSCCPLCRQKLADIHELRSELRSLERPVMPFAELAELRAAFGQRLAPETIAPGFRLIEARGSWLETWLLPSAAGALVSLVLGFLLLAVVLSPLNSPTLVLRQDRGPASDVPIYLASADPLDISPLQYANTRFAVSGESPSINPHGALIALTRSLVRGEMKDEEVVVVADVFGNGLARIAEVVEPTHDRRTIIELQRALQSDPDFAPFVPAEMDRRSENIRVVLKIQSVDVDTSGSAPAN